MYLNFRVLCLQGIYYVNFLLKLKIRQPDKISHDENLVLTLFMFCNSDSSSNSIWPRIYKGKREKIDERPEMQGRVNLYKLKLTLRSGEANKS